MVSNKILKKALWILENKGVIPEGKGWYKVLASDGSYHQVNLDRVTCDCTWFSLRQKPCSHLLAAYIFDRLGKEFLDEFFTIQQEWEKNKHLATEVEEAWQDGFESCFERLISILTKRFGEEVRRGD